jgi:putative redox protein
MDISHILRKRRKTIEEFEIVCEAERAPEDPHVFTSIHMEFVLTSPDATLHELEQAIELSWSKYCSVSIMLQRSGCTFSSSAALRTTAKEMQLT